MTSTLQYTNQMHLMSTLDGFGRVSMRALQNGWGLICEWYILFVFAIVLYTFGVATRSLVWSSLGNFYLNLRHAVIQMWWFGDAQDRKNTQHVLKEPVLLSKLQALKKWGDQSNGVDTLKKNKTLSTYSLCSFFLSVSFFLFHCCLLPVRFLLGSLVRWHQSATSN